MEIIISVILGIWVMLAGVLCIISYKNDFAYLLNKNFKEYQEEERK